MTINYYERIHTCLLANLDAELIVWPESLATGQVCTGRFLLDRVSACRRGLVGRGVKPGQRVLLVLPVSVALICNLLAIMSVGAIPVLPPAAATRQILLKLVLTEPLNAVLTQRRLPRWLAWLLHWRGIIAVNLDSIGPSAGDWLPPKGVDSEQPALISYSSGSTTGRPSAIQRPHRVLLAQHEALRVAFPPWPAQRDFPLFANVLLHNLATGTVTILPDLPGFDVTRMNPARIVQQLRDQRVETLTGNVFYVQQLLRHLAQNPQTFPHVRAVGIGGSPVPESLLPAVRAYFAEADVYVIYGSSEAEPIAVRLVGAEPENPRVGYAVGRVHPTLHLRIRPLGTLTLGDGTSVQAGEIDVSGAHVATAPNGWLATGDFGYLDVTNQLMLTGRRGNETIHAGVQHYQIEHVLRTEIPQIRQVAARATASGFAIYIEGDTTDVIIQDVLKKNFPAGIFTGVYFREKIPVDARHHTKIRYGELR